MSYAENIRLMIDASVSVMWIVATLSIVRLIITDYKMVSSVGQALSKTKREHWFPLLVPLWEKVQYIVGGALLVSFSYSITAIIYRMFPEVLTDNVPANTILSVSNQSVLFILCIIFFMMSGYFLMLSLGTKWLLNLSKLFATLAVIGIVASALLPYLPSSI